MSTQVQTERPGERDAQGHAFRNTDNLIAKRAAPAITRTPRRASTAALDVAGAVIASQVPTERELTERPRPDAVEAPEGDLVGGSTEADDAIAASGKPEMKLAYSMRDLDIGWPRMLEEMPDKSFIFRSPTPDEVALDAMLRAVREHTIAELEGEGEELMALAAAGSRDDYLTLLAHHLWRKSKMLHAPMPVPTPTSVHVVKTFVHEKDILPVGGDVYVHVLHASDRHWGRWMHNRDAEPEQSGEHPD